jgi:aminoglycoside 3-N-acetyltransferase I
MTYTYKKLCADDVPALRELLGVFGEAFGDVDTYQSAMPGEEYLRSLLLKQDFIVLIALADDTIVGGLAAYVLEKFEQERLEIYIYDLAVAKPHRRRGVATKLISDLKKIARERSASVIYVQADRTDDAAIKLYESLGTKKAVFHFDITP